MQKEIHPKYHVVEVVCSCGSSFYTKSTTESDIIRIEICKNCHPFFTGKRKAVDTAGRIEKFNKKYNLE